MAKRRCISIDFYDSEEFCELPNSAKVLYTEMILHSDDDGVVVNPKAVLRICRMSKSVLSLLVEKKFVLVVDDVYIIRHWRVHNKVPPSRKIDSIYAEQLLQLYVDDRKVYCPIVDKSRTEC